MKVRVSVKIRKLSLKKITRVLDNVTIISITTVRVTIIHETANTKAVLQAILVQILTVALKLVFCLTNPNSIRTFTSILLIYTINTRICCLPKCLHYAGSQHLMLWNQVVSNGLVITGVLVLVSQMVFVSKVPKCLESAEMQGDIPQPIYIYIFIFYVAYYIHKQYAHMHMSAMSQRFCF